MCNDSKEHEEECFVDKKYDINSVYKKYVATELYAPLLVVLGWVGLSPNFSTCSGLGWVGSVSWCCWIGLGHTKWTHGQL